MKPYLLVVLLAIPALISAWSAREEFVPAAEAAKPESASVAPRAVPSRTTLPPNTTVPTRAPAPAVKPTTAARGTAAQARPWWLM